MALRTGLEVRPSTAMLSEDVQLLTFKLDDQEYALHIGNVVQVIRMVAITRAPKAPETVEGLINLRGRVIPVINLRKRFGLSHRPIDLNTHLLIARNGDKVLALVVDVVSEVLTMPGNALEFSGLEMETTDYLWAVGKLGDRLVLVLDLEKTLSYEDERRLQQILSRQPAAQSA
jgi:purine-binding chemotaxis protein CheW